MTLERCPSCKKKISIEATTCPSCGHPLTDGWAVPERKKRIKETWQGFGIFVALIGGIVLWVYLSRSDPDPCGDRDRALIAAEGFVQNRLKSPSSASFVSSFDAQVAKKSCGKWIIRSAVDAPNDYGAKIRTHFLATVELKATGGWRLVDLTFIR